MSESTTATADTTATTQQTAATATTATATTQQTQTQTQPINFASFVGEDGSLKEGWAKAWGAPDGWEKKFSNLKPMLGSYAALERLQLNGEKISLPKDGASDEEWATFYARLGRPENPDKYELAIPDELKGATLDENAMKEFRSVAFKNGLNGKQVKALTEYYFKSTKSALDAVNAQTQQRFDATVAELAKEWGPKDGPKWKENVANAEKGAAALGLSAEVLQSTPELSNNPHFIRAMAKVAEMTKEGSSANPRSNGGMTFGGDVDAQIKAVFNDPNHAYHKRDHPGHKDAVATMEALFRRKHGG